MLKQITEILKFKLIDTKSIDFTIANLLVLLFALIFTSVILKLIRKVVTRNLSTEDKNKFVSVFQFAKYVIYVLVFMFILHSSGINMNVFITASAALFVGIGFALQTFFQDIISGILMILDQSLHVGDIIEVDGKVGQVKEIKLRTTRVVTRNDRVMIIPNHKFMIETLFNWTQNNSTNRENVTVGVAYGSDVNLVKQILIDCAKSTEGIVLPESITVLFEDFADSSLNFAVYFHVANGMNSPRIQSDIRFKIDQEFRRNNIQIPFPQRDIRIITNKEI